MSLRAFVQAMPKAELHVHLEGSVQPQTLLDLAAQNGVTLPAADVAGLRDWYTFRDFDHFIEIYLQICACLQTPEDFTRITYEYGCTMAEHNIRYAEVTWTPASHVNAQLPFEALLAGVNAGRAQAEQEWDIQMQWILDISRNQPHTASDVVRWTTSSTAREGHVVALGLGGPEVGWPPEMYETAFREGLEQGTHSNPHAGETVGPESVWGALRALRAERIGHGVRAIEDPALLDLLVEQQIPLEVNPTSNLCLGVYPDYSKHPLRTLIEAGACVTINSDDPPLFNTTLTDEYQHAVEDCGLTIDQLIETALNAVRVAYLPENKKAALLAEFQTAYAQLRAQYAV